MRIKTCFNCKGTGRTFDPSTQLEDPICGLCQGAGVVRVDITCRCGRPIVEYTKTGALSCGFKVCSGWTSESAAKEEAVQRINVRL